MNQLEELKLKDLIYEIRGKQVMLASDVAKLYNSETKIINQVVKRNINRFPEDFCFQLTKEELNLWFQNGTANISSKSRTSPHVFTEEGVAMLATVPKFKNKIFKYIS